MMFRRKLWKRILPVVLSVAMVLETMPATALAAEYEENEVVQETVLEETVTDDNDVEASNAETKDVDVQGESSTSQETTTTGTDTDDNKSETDIVTATENITEAAETERESEAVENVAAEEINAKAALDTKITINLEEGKTYSNGALTVKDGVVTGAYTGEGVFDDFVNTSIKNFSYTGNIVQVKVDGIANSSLKSNLTFEWKTPDAEGNYTQSLPAGSTTPTAVGSYALKISLKGAANVCQDAETYIYFEIEQKELEIEGPDHAKIGSKLADFEAEVKENYTLKLDGKRVDRDTFIKTGSFTVAIVDIVTGETLAYDGNTVFEKEKDYAYTVSAELNDANYKLAAFGQVVIKLEGDIDTNLEITSSKIVEFTYTGTAITAPTPTVKVTYTNEDGEEVAIADPAITQEWLDADGNEMAEGDMPVNAGNYSLKLTYTDETGRYAESEDFIKVVINPMPVYVKTSISPDTYVDGVSISDILKNVDYEVLKTDGDTAPEGYDKETFWGVSYADKSKTQSYEPVFKLQVSELVLDADNKPEKDKDGNVQYTDFVDNGNRSLTAEVVEGYLKAKYRVVFSGKKVVYEYETVTTDTDADGDYDYDYTLGKQVGNPVDVNGHGDTNYKVDLSNDVISKNAVEVKITASTVKIDTTAYDALNKTKIYDGAPLYKSRSEYKLATVNGNGDNLTYTWYYCNVKKTPDENGNEKVEYTRGAEVPDIDENLTYVDAYQYKGVAPSDAGTYLLAISYKDSATGESASTEVKPFVIEEQKVQAQLVLADGQEALTTYTGLAINNFKWDYLYDSDLLHTVNPIVGNVLEPEITLGNALDWRYYSDYTLSYIVERQDNITGEWKEATEFTFEEGCVYRLRAKVLIESSNLKKNYQSNDKYDENKDGKQEYYLSNPIAINVVKMGTTEVAIDIDASKFTDKVKKYDAQPFVIPDGAITVKRTSDGADVTNEVELTYEWYDYTEGYSLPAAINAGTYDLYVSFVGNENYKPCESDEVVKDFEIIQRSVTIKPVVKEPVIAGTTVSYSSVVTNYAFTEDSDILDSELLLFTTYNIFKSVSGVIRTADGKVVPNSVLRGEETYYALPTSVRFNEDFDYLYFERNYEVKYEKTEFTTARGNATVTKDNTSIKDYINGMAHTIAPKEGVAYYFGNKSPVSDEKGNKVSGNFLIFNIRAPKEYFAYGNNESGAFIPLVTDEFVYENSVKKEAGGYVLSGNGSAYSPIRIAIPITKDDVDNKTQKTFKIRWEKGYVETFTVDCTGVVLEADLTKAVAPKSLAFNAPITKMAVGERQQLDVKITKANLDDVICLKYELKEKGTEYISVSETGMVVALSVGTATVEAIPCYKDENGDLQEIEGAKRAAVKLSVVDVTAPKIKGITPYDTYALVEYPSVSDGYRREIYVMKGKGLKDSDFSAIDNIKNGDWKSAGLAIAPVYDTHASTVKGDMTRVWIGGLTPGEDYTVYVRNVSGIRKLADGTSVVASKAGSVKSFKMTLPQVEALSIYLDENYYDSKLNGVYLYTVPLSQKTVTATTTGWYREIYANKDANTGDFKEYTLPLAKEQTETYAQPKLTYSASVYTYNSHTGRFEWDATTKIAKVDQKGKLTFSGVGLVRVLVQDSITEEYDFIYILVTATADKMEIAKSAKLKVGQKVNLFDLLTYYEGKTKLIGYRDYKSILYSLERGTGIKLDLSSEGDIDGFVIEEKSEEKYGDGDGIRIYDSVGEVTAVAPNKTMTVDVTDTALNQTAAITITSGAIDPVKNLKVTMVTDKYATISFAYSVYDMDWEAYDTTETKSSNQVYFRIQVTDASKRVVRDEYYNMFELNPTEIDKKGMVTFTTTLGGFTRKSTYNVSVTACCLDQMAKPASKAIKTTDIPAAYPYEHYDGDLCDFYLYSKDPNSAYMTADGGIKIALGNGMPLKSYPALTSNNTYTLVAYPDNNEAKNRLSDILTWKSSDAKVASVKANTGSYTATLKTLKKGTTKIEVSSKITKRIIARWTVFVNAVGEASYYFGDFEPEEDGDWGNALGGFEYSEVHLLTLDNPITVNLANGEVLLAKFVAPAEGWYEFSTTQSMLVYDMDGKRQGNLNTKASAMMEQGETRYFEIPRVNDRRSVSVNLSVSDYTIYETMSMSGITLNKSATVVFTAPEDNYYELYRKGTESDTLVQTIGGMKQGEKLRFSLSAGTYIVKKREITSELSVEGKKEETIPANTTNWYTFTAPLDMEYTFESGSLSAEIYYDITFGNSMSGNAFKKGHTYYIAVTNDTEEDVKTDITVKQHAQVIAASGTSIVNLENAGELYWAQITVKEEDAGKYYIAISAAAGEGETPAVSVNGYSSISNVSHENGNVICTLTEGTARIGFSSDTANTKVTVTISKITKTTQTISESDTNAAVNAGGYAFAAKTAGDYVFRAEPIKVSDDKTIDVFVIVYDEDGREHSTISRAADSNSVKCALTAGETVYVRYYTSEDTTATEVTIKIEKLVPEVFTTSWSGELKVGEDAKRLQFKAPADGRYVITPETKQKTEGGTGTVTVNGSLPTERYFKQGAGFDVELTATGADVDYTITVSPITVETLTNEELTFKAKETKWLQFTPVETGKYTVAYTGATTYVSIDKFSTLTQLSADYTVLDKLVAGTPVYYKLTNETESEQKVTLVIAQLKAEEMTLSDNKKESTLSQGDAAIYSFKAPKTGYYSFDASASDAGEGKTATASIRYYKDLEGTSFTNRNAMLNVIYLEATKTVYLESSWTSNDGAETAKVTTSVTAINSTALALGAEPTSITRTESGIDWYTISGEGTYTVTISDATASNAYYATNSSPTSFSGFSTREITLNAEDTCTIAVKYDANAAYKIAATKRDVKELSLDSSVTATLRQNDILYVSFTLPETGRYAVTLDGLTDDVTASMTDTSGNAKYVESTDIYYTFTGNIHQKVTFAITTNIADAEKSVNLTVKAAAVIPTTVTDLTQSGNATIDVNNVKEGYMSWYSFTAQEDGLYVIKTSDATVSKLYAYDLTSRLYSDSSQARTISLDKGETIYYAVWYDKKPEANVTFSIIKQEITPIPAEGKTLNLKADEYQYVSITPEIKGGLEISVTVSDGIVYTNARKSLGDLAAASFTNETSGTLDITAEAGNAVYVGFYANQEGTVTISYTEGVLEKLKEGTNTVSLENGEKTLSFTAEEDGVYFFDTSATIGVEADGDSLNSKYVYIKRGRTALVTVTSYYSSVSVTVLRYAAYEVKESDLPYQLEINGYVYFKFTATEEGIYDFYSTNDETSVDTKAYLYDYTSYQQLDSDDDGGGNQNFIIHYSLVAGQTVLLLTQPYSDGNIDKLYTVHIEKGSEESTEE